jgi:hypothetical protein
VVNDEADQRIAVRWSGECTNTKQSKVAVGALYRRYSVVWLLGGRYRGQPRCNDNKQQPAATINNMQSFDERELAACAAFVVTAVQRLDAFEIGTGGDLHGRAEDIMDVLLAVALSLDYVGMHVAGPSDDAAIVTRFWAHFAPDAVGAVLPPTWREFAVTAMRSLVLSAYKNIYHVFEEVGMAASPERRRVRVLRRGYVRQLRGLMDGKDTPPGDAVPVSPPPAPGPPRAQGMWRAIGTAVPEVADGGEAGHKRPRPASSSSSSSSSSSGAPAPRRAGPSQQTTAILQEMSAFLGEDADPDTSTAAADADTGTAPGPFYFSTGSSATAGGGEFDGERHQHPKKRLLRRRYHT